MIKVGLLQQVGMDHDVDASWQSKSYHGSCAGKQSSSSEAFLQQNQGVKGHLMLRDKPQENSSVADFFFAWASYISLCKALHFKINKLLTTLKSNEQQQNCPFYI